ncbi:MAG: DUF4326 domain-containing protein [Nanoarchaeota archaeon]
MPEILNKHHLKSMPENAIMCDRTGKFGNIFKIGNLYNGRKMTREDVISAHQDWLFYSSEGIEVLKYLPELEKYDAWICWCAPLPCHCDLYFKLLFIASFSFPCPVIDCHKQNYFKLRKFCSHYEKKLQLN